MKISLQRDLAPDLDYYYNFQFRIYDKSYLLWDRDLWDMILSTGAVFRVLADGEEVGDVILEDEGKGTVYITDLSILPEYQRKGVGKAIIEEIKKMGRKITAVTRKETLDFFFEIRLPPEKDSKKLL
jgi:GNAT superfamily N-acetyltransferase